MGEITIELRKRNDWRNSLISLQRIDPVYIACIMPIKATIENHSISTKNYTAIAILRIATTQLLVSLMNGDRLSITWDDIQEYKWALGLKRGLSLGIILMGDVSR